MKALLYKELIGLKLYAKSILFVMLIFLITSATMQSNGFSGFISTMLVMVAVMSTVTSFSYDDYNNWSGYALSFPISRKGMVLSKYVLALITLGVGIVLALVFMVITGLLNGFSDVTEQFVSMAAGGCVGLIMIGIVLPIIYKYGANKARILLMAVFIVPVLLLGLVAKLNLPMPSEQTFQGILLCVPILAIAIFVISYFVSVKIIAKKEF